MLNFGIIYRKGVIFINTATNLQLSLFDDNSLSPTNNIKTHKNLADCRYNLSINEIKILLGLISLSIKNENDTGFKTFKFSITGLANFLGFKYQNRCRDIRKAIEKLKKSEVILPDPNAKSIKERPIVPWIVRSQISESKDFVDLKLNTELEKYLINSHFEPNYLTYQLAIIMQMKSSNSIKMYHILLKNFWKNSEKIIKNDFTITVDELKEMLMIPKEMYQSAGNFRIKVLNVAQKECEMYSDIIFTFTPIKKGKQIYKYKFEIFSNPNYKPVPIELEPISSQFTGAEELNSIINNATKEGYKEVISKLNYYKLSKSGIAEIIDLCSPEEILELIKTAEELKANNIPGFIRASCRDIAQKRNILNECEPIFNEIINEEKTKETKKEIEKTQLQIAAQKEDAEHKKKIASAKRYLKKLGIDEFNLLITEFLNSAPEVLKHNFNPNMARTPKEKSYNNLIHYLVIYKN